MSGGGSLVAHEASAVATQKSNAILMSFTQVGSGIRANIKDSISVEPATAIGDTITSSLARGVQVQPGDTVFYVGTNS